MTADRFSSSFPYQKKARFKFLLAGERAVDIVRVAAIAMSGGLRVEDMARILLSFPTYTGILGRAAYRAAEQLGLETRAGGQPEDAFQR